MAGGSRTWVHFGNPLRLTLCKQCVMPKAEEVYELLEIYLDKDNNQLWGHLGRRRYNTIVEVVCAQKVESEARFEYNMTIYGFYEIMFYLCC